MKKISFLMAALLVAMVGCQKEPQAQTQGNGLNPEDKVYMEFQIQTLTTRSSTNSDADDNYVSSDAAPNVEVGQNYENNISTVDVVLRSANSYVSAQVVNPAAEDDGNYKTWVAEFASSQLETGVNYEVYIYVNCSAKQDLNATSEADIATITDKTDNGKFWMTSAYTPATKNFDAFSTDKNNPTDIGTHYVERVMARLDYMPKGPYTLGDGVQVTLKEAALINQSKSFYMLRRVSSDGTNTNWVIGGVETPLNYVVDTDYSDKQDGYGANDASLFDYHMSTSPDTWQWKSIVKTDEWVPDNWEGTDDGKTDYDGTHILNDYYIWQYAKENTIPKEPKNQQNGLSTGIVFKGELSGDLVTAAAGQPIYVFENVLYGTWDKVVAAAKEANASESLKFAVSVCNNDGTAKDSATLAAAGFTGYSAVDGKYYTYYYYWNRHNDNGDNTAMGQMEFAVVRNNVYKLCVDSISKYGHPTPGGTDPDPDPVNPTDPDEEGEYYFKVTVKVLPWVVRVNHIEF
ncbi:MAG: hypothetical protein E7116_07955 [Bacteroidales bacterium]|nr:hypothetical protein [Bacteroidales bacterium]